MERAFLLALTCAAAVSAVNYVDYSGVKMPQYIGNADYEMGRDPPPSHPSEDYHGNSPDAPASLDYKYEEDLHIKSEKPRKSFDESDAWRKSFRKQRGSKRVANNDNSMRNKYNSDDDDDDLPKLKGSRQFPKHRSRLKTDSEIGEEDVPPRRHNKYSRDRKGVSDIDRMDYFHVDHDYNPDDKSKDFDFDIKFRPTTIKRLNHRRPRDRQFKKQKNNIVDSYEEDLEADRQTMSDFEKVEKDSRSGDDIRQQLSEQRVTASRVRHRTTVNDDEENRVKPIKNRPVQNKQKDYGEYEDYYDMKRVNNLKNKLPTLLRRTTVAESETNMNLMEMMMTHRRSLETSEPSSTVRTLHPTPTYHTVENIIVTTTVPTTSSTTATTTIDYNKRQSNIMRDLSLAEKSRLSILKKAQRKEGMVVHSTKKPPVLLQVTSHMPTVVMVEPPSPSGPWMRAQEFVEDSPQKIERVKSLMRHFETHSTSVSVAERELKAALGAHRQRKDVTLYPAMAASTRSELMSVPTFAPNAVSLDVKQQWQEFIAANNSKCLNISMYFITFLALIINILKRYDYCDII